MSAWLVVLLCAIVAAVAVSGTLLFATARSNGDTASKKNTPETKAAIDRSLQTYRPYLAAVESASVGESDRALRTGIYDVRIEEHRSALVELFRAMNEQGSFRDGGSRALGLHQRTFTADNGRDLRVSIDQFRDYIWPVRPSFGEALAQHESASTADAFKSVMDDPFLKGNARKDRS